MTQKDNLLSIFIALMNYDIIRQYISILYMIFMNMYYILKWYIDIIYKYNNKYFLFCLPCFLIVSIKWNNRCELCKISSTITQRQSIFVSILHLALLPLATNYWRRKWQPIPALLPRKIPWVEEPGRLQSMGSRRVRHNWGTSLSLFTFMHWRRKWQHTPVILPGEFQGRGSLAGSHRVGHD